MRQLIKEKCDGVDARFALKIGRSATQVARWFMEDLKHRRNIGESLAREIEKVFKLPRYWLDQDGDIVVPQAEMLDPERHRRFNELAEWLTAEQMTEVLSDVDKLLHKMAIHKRTNEVAVRTFGGAKKAMSTTKKP